MAILFCLEIFNIVIDYRSTAEQEASKDLLQHVSADTTILQGNVITMGKKAGFLEKTAQHWTDQK